MNLAHLGVRTVRTLVLILVVSATVGGIATQSASAADAPAWRLSITPGPTNFTSASANVDKYQVTAVNVGGAATDGTPITISDELPGGLQVDAAGAEGRAETPHEVTALSCSSGPPASCVSNGPLQPGEAIGMTVSVDVEAGAPLSVLDLARVSGGGAATATAESSTTISSMRAPFGFQSAASWLTNGDGSPTTQAGAHPYALTVRFTLNDILEGEVLPPSGDAKDVIANLPAGVVVNPNATSVKCTEAELESDATIGGGCPAASQVGTIRVTPGFKAEVSDVPFNQPLYNMVPPSGVPASLGFDAVGAGIYVHLLGGVRTGSDYGITSTTPDILQKGMITSAEATLWGSPTDPSHDELRGACAAAAQKGLGPCPTVVRRNIPFVTLPSACSGPLTTAITADSWQEPGVFLPVEAFETRSLSGTPAGIEGCSRLNFSPSVTVRPEPGAAVADSPSGLEFDLKVPQEENVAGLAESDVRDVALTLPQGMSGSPSAANGLGACAPAEVQLHAEGQVGSCPASAKIGTTEVVTPLLEKPMQGALYVAQQGNGGAAQGANPFGSLLAVYLIAEGSGVRLKLAGRIEANAATGQLTIRFEGNPPDAGEPQLPFSDLKVRMFGGPRAALVMPAACGSYESTTTLTPWDGNAPVSRASTFNVTSGCGGGFAPSFTAGSTNNQAGGFSPVSLSFSRQDGEQRIGGLEATLPPGLLAKLAGVPLCGEAEANAGSCGEASRIGTVTVGAGTGPDPYYVQGKVYLTGPYNSGPFGEVAVIPAVAGPFNLGTVVVRGSIRVNPATAQASVVSDAFPTILQGIPLQIKSIHVSLDRPGFTFNPTDCTPLSVAGTIISTTGTRANVSSAFEAANCATLPFKPVFSASTQGHTSKLDGASLRVKIASAGIGQANITKVDLTIPNILPSRLTTLQKACTEAQFNANPGGCPAASDIATAVVHTPLLNVPLVGPVYFVSHGGAAFPDTEMVLQGEHVTLILDGHTQIKNGVTYSRFETVPDAPFTSFEFVAPEGPYSIFGANGNLCQTEIRMPTTLVAQNGAVLTQSTLVEPEGCPDALTILSHTVKNRTLALRVALPAAGRLTAAGKHLTKASKIAGGRGIITLTLKATGNGKVNTKVKLTFVPPKGNHLTATLSARFKR